MRKMIDAYAQLSEIKEHIIEWDYTAQSGDELIEFISEIIDRMPCVIISDEFELTNPIENDDQEKEEKIMDSVDLRDFYVKTVPYMFSDDFRVRMVAEYNQLQYRLIKLNHAIKGSFLRDADMETMKEQLRAMTEYRDALWHRILDLGIDHAYRGELIL